MLRLLLVSLLSTAMLSLAAPQPKVFNRPLAFEPNRGQASEQVKWLARGPGYQLFVTREGMTLSARESTVSMKPAGGRTWDDITALNPTGGVSNYFRGVGKKDTIGNIPQYTQLKITGVYKDIDLLLYSRGGDLEYDFVLPPGADPKQIRLNFEGQDRLRTDSSGDLVLTMKNGSEITQVRPRIYQEAGARRIDLAGGYHLLANGQAAFTIAPYDSHRQLVIDPEVSLVRFVGGSAGDSGSAVAVDSAGNSYITGSTFSDNFPSTAALQPGIHCQAVVNHTCTTGTDAFVTKVSPTGTLLFSTYLGGTNYDSGTGIAVDATGVYIVGDTSSSDFPNKVPDGSADARRGGQDAFVAKLSLDGSQLMFSRLISGSGSDTAKAIALDSQHSAWVTGVSTSGLVRVGEPFRAVLTTVQGPSDVFYSKFDSAGEWLFSGLLGGSGDDIGAAVAIDSRR